MQVKIFDVPAGVSAKGKPYAAFKTAETSDRCTPAQVAKIATELGCPPDAVREDYKNGKFRYSVSGFMPSKTIEV